MNHALSRREFLAGLAVAAAPASLPAGLRVFPEVVNVGVLERHGRRLLVDCGEGDLAAQSGAPIDWVLFTHHHRDQWSGARRIHAVSPHTKFAVPAAERRFFAEAEQFWDTADSILDHRYDFRPHLFTGTRSIPVARALAGGEVLEWEGLRIEALATPGHTGGSLSYLTEIGGKRVAFTGDLLYGAPSGLLPDFYSLQKRFPGMRGDYWGFGGAVDDVLASLDCVLAARPDLLVPSHGKVVADPGTAIAGLQQNLRAAMDNFLHLAAWRIYFPGIFPAARAPLLPPLAPAEYPKWIRHIASTTKAIVAGDGSVFLSDCGHPAAISTLDKLLASGEFRSIDGLWITHYHDDHTEQVNVAKRKYGARVHVERHLVDILENPTAYQMPCLFPESIRVERPMDHGESIEWKGFRLTAYYFPGQTLYHDGLLVERDGLRVLFTGDSFANFGIDDYCSQNRCFLGPNMGYEKCFDLLLDIKPDLLIAAHWGPVPISPDYIRRAQDLFAEREKLFARLFPYDNPNFGLDPCWIRAYPYRQRALPGDRVSLEARIFNHSSRPKPASVELRVPEGWAPAGPARATIPPRTEGRLRFETAAPASLSRRRHLLTLAVTFDDIRCGEFAEAIVDILAA
ncbi:MAG TPA: MBL fold metallo-hydrolase [Bryobacterales bacterium]|nr:MBL fold metallo-hydrolase [Bryobacterales bacterium]